MSAKKKLSSQPVSWSGVYIENCVDVQYGFSGSLEVASHEAFESFLKEVSMHAAT